MMARITRRRFVKIGTAAALCALCPSSLLRAQPPAAKVIDCGPLTDFKEDGIYEAFVGREFFLIRSEGRLYAASNICTDEVYTLTPAPDRKSLYCRKHKSYFNLDGSVLKGRPKVGLPRFRIGLDARKHVIVDLRESFSQERWNEAGASLAV